MSKINDKLKLAMARYYHERDSRYSYHRIEGTIMELRQPRDDGKKWDKEAALNNIANVAKASGFSVTACAGTFWFRKGRESIECNEKNYLDGGTRTLDKKPKQPATV